MDSEAFGRDISVSQRQIYILSLLSENPKGYQAEEIRQRLLGWDIHVSRRTIQRDIDELSLNYGIVEEERDGKTYFSADKYTLKNVDFTIEDLASLAFTKEMLKNYSHLEIGQHAIAFIDKMVEKSASLNKLQFDKLGGQFRQSGIAGNKDAVDWKTERILQNAIDNRNMVEIEYYSFTSDESTVRVIHPYGMLMLDSYLCVEGYCELRKDVRRFRVSRIRHIETLDTHYTEDIPEDKRQGFLSLVGGEKESLELKFTGDSIRYVKEYEAGRAKRLEEREDGLYFYQETAITPDVVRWVRGFGPEIEVISPVWLSRQLRKEAEERL